jgi:hypothetical protein
MSAATATPAAQDQPSRVGRLLDLARRLILYGKQLATTLQQRGVTPDLARAFGSLDVGLILARIARGLLLANAREARLVQCADRPDVAPRARGASAPRGPRAAGPATRRTPEADPRLADLPTPEQIAAQLRRRPIGADICRDLGILPSHPLWRELSRVIIKHGGSLANLVKDLMQRAFQGWQAAQPAASPAPLPQRLAPAGTGPP